MKCGNLDHSRPLILVGLYFTLTDPFYFRWTIKDSSFDISFHYMPVYYILLCVFGTSYKNLIFFIPKCIEDEHLHITATSVTAVLDGFMNLGLPVIDDEDDIFPKKTDHPLLNRQRAYHQRKREKREAEKREKYDSEMRTKMIKMKNNETEQPAETQNQ